uniref:Uncharacterized protein n=1 Tax=Lactuca sativa TaxID=4236 RepID=A0A9R1X5G0_LACSA|nr:hypothetical protein LSAT_V11C700375930 [Lactuca sativa]
MKDVWDIEIIDVEIDKDFKKKCTDVFLNNLCPNEAGEEDDAELNEYDVVDEKYHFDINREGSGSDDIYGTDEEVSSESDKDYEVECEYNTHTPRIK